MKPIYDRIGVKYAGNRQTDPRIAEQINATLVGARRVVNIGAGTGSYEPHGVDLIAVEPSKEMIAQRPTGSAPVVQAEAESLPFEDNAFTHALTVLSMHHWTDRAQAFAEINRVATEQFVAVSWNPEAEPFWLTRDYFPEIHANDQQLFPGKQEFEQHFDEVSLTPLLIPEDCVDGFLAAYWKRPEAYLQANVRQSRSVFAKRKDLAGGLQKLQSDLESGAWEERNEGLLSEVALDAGYVIVKGRVRG